MNRKSPIDPFLEQNSFLLLDGGLATELEKMGFRFGTGLWSAHLLKTNPHAIRDVHLSYLYAGSDCIITSSYQASIPGFIKEGFSVNEAKHLIKFSVTIVQEACDEFMNSHSTNRIRPLVAGSIGPYGAYLTDGAEYRGNYKTKKIELREFHESRWEILLNSTADLFACETIPSFTEAEVLLDLISETTDRYFWISFSCRDEKHISDGTPIAEVVSLFENCNQVLAVGINCTPPEYIDSLIDCVKKGAPSKQIVVYPNSGERYEATNKKWVGNPDPDGLASNAVGWYNRGAKIIGGCCRTGPEHIKAIRKVLTEFIK